MFFKLVWQVFKTILGQYASVMGSILCFQTKRIIWFIQMNLDLDCYHIPSFSYMFDIVAMIELHDNSGFKRTHRHPHLSSPFCLIRWHVIHIHSSWALDSTSWLLGLIFLFPSHRAGCWICQEKYKDLYTTARRKFNLYGSSFSEGMVCVCLNL